MTLFDALGFRWNRAALPASVACYSVARVCFRLHKMLAEFVWDASVLEGNPFTFVQVKTLLDGVTVGGHKLSDQAQVLNLAQSAKQLLAQVKSGQFSLSKPVFTGLHRLVAREEALEWGWFRGEGQQTHYTPGVSLGEHGRYMPPPTTAGGENLNSLFNAGVAALQTCPPLERALAFFLFGALQQFFFDGNKRTSRLMMNGVLMSHGIDAISVPAASAQVFNEKMVRFYLSKDASEMMAFLIHCLPDIRCLPDAAV